MSNTPKRRTRPPTTPRRKHTYLVDPDVDPKLQAFSAACGVSMSALINMVMRAYFDSIQYDETQPATHRDYIRMPSVWLKRGEPNE